MVDEIDDNDGGAFDLGESAKSEPVTVADPLSEGSPAEPAPEPVASAEPAPEPVAPAEPAPEPAADPLHEFQPSLAARENFDKLRKQFEDRLAEASADGGGEWEAKYNELNDQYQQMQSEMESMNQSSSEMKERLKILDLENDPDFQAKYDYSQELTTAKKLADKVGITEGTVEKLSKMDEFDRVAEIARLTADAEDPAAAMVMQAVQTQLNSVSSKMQSRSKAMEDVESTRARIQQERRDAEQRVEAQRIQQDAIVARRHFDEAMNNAMTSTQWWHSEEGQIAMAQVQNNFAEQKYTVRDHVSNALSAQLVEPYRNLAVQQQSEIMNLRKLLEQGGMDFAGTGAGGEVASTGEKGGGLYDLQ